MTWLCAKTNKPLTDANVLVSNFKSWMHGVRAFYCVTTDLWYLAEPARTESIVLDVTHYLLVPDIMTDNKEIHDKSI